MKLTFFIIIFLIAIFVISLFTKVGNRMIRIYKTRSIGAGTLSFLFMFPALIVGIRNKYNLFARIGIGGSIVLIVVITSSLFMGIA